MNRLSLNKIFLGGRKDACQSKFRFEFRDKVDYRWQLRVQGEAAKALAHKMHKMAPVFS